ncbi:hypothetical protein Q2K19_24630 [Micromonospora soli]|uniref:Tc toxin subunit A-related protein n=1 Tax=Micromonospora sp. NBRC 110009 TaxID=3061627 RepID=UPI0026716AB6|nr:neuraminidase-like domain-containing protein [Micromonospora sp. NBRC 110009]WKT97336.1 hypothetical protein Q2K19_24630 [Micromonospora sp. NBRC 110009]
MSTDELSSPIPTARSVSLLPIDGGGGDPDPIPIAPKVGISSPAASATVSGAEPGMLLTVTGTYSAGTYSVTGVSVRMDGFTYPAALNGSTKTWSATVRAYRAGTDSIIATVSAENIDGPIDVSTSRSVVVALASPVPVVTVSQPVAGQTVTLQEAGATIGVIASTSTDYGSRTMRVTCSDKTQDMSRSGSTYTGSAYLSPLPLGSRAVTVSCTDAAGNMGTRTVNVTAVDGAPPSPQITYPAPGLVIPTATAASTVTVTGTSADTQSGMSGGSATIGVGQTATAPTQTATPIGGTYANWKADVAVTGYGAHTVYVWATDAAGNRTGPISVPFQLVSTYVPPDLPARLDGRAYLAALLAFAQERVTTPQGALNTAQLVSVLVQHLDKISEPATPAADVGRQEVNQLRVPVELLRAYLAAKGISTAPGAAGEAAYLSAAYAALLAGLGTSYTELRLARGAATADRQALADRLGIPLSATRPDELDKLVLDGPALTEAALETLFGLLSTTVDPLARNPVVPRVQEWQLAGLAARWAAADQAPPGPRAYAVLVDPDVIGAADVVADPRGDAVRQLLTTRSATLSSFAQSLETARRGAANPSAGLTAMLNLALPGVDLAALETAERGGADIGPALDAANLTRAGFAYLRQLARLGGAAGTANPVTEAEWADAVAVLVGVRRRSLYPTWRGQEGGISVSPALFRPDQPGPQVNPLRADPAARAAWQSTLASRVAQQQALFDGYADAVAAAEQAALPILRDALVADVAAAPAAAAPPGTGDIGERMTGLYQIDMKAGGTLRTTRQAQAIESLQSLLFAIRSGELPTNHPAVTWQLTGGRAAFDGAWRWMGDQASWQTAIQTFLFPERHLDPALLLPRSTPPAPMDALWSGMAGSGPFTAADAANAAAAYLAAQRAANGAFPSFTYLDPQHTAAHQSALANLSSTMATTNPTLAREVFWAVPLLIAQRLQAAGEYLAALDWYWLVYPYDAVVPSAFPSSYHVVNTELATAPVRPNLTFPPGWTNDLHPFHLLTGRPAPYTRYALLAQARCHIDYADAEFTRETDASIARARGLYLTAAMLLAHPWLAPVAPINAGEPTLAIPELTTLANRVQVQLAKLRQGRNIAGMARTQGALASIGISQPTPYRYKVLMERCRQLVAQATQVEAAYLAALEKYDSKTLQLYDAQKALAVSDAQVDLQAARVVEAGDAVVVARDQQARAAVIVQTHQANIAAPPNYYEQRLLDGYPAMRDVKNVIAAADTVIGVAQAASTATDMFKEVVSFGGAGVAGAAMAAASVARGIATGVLNNMEAQMQANQLMAGIEQRRTEWRTQLAAAQQDAIVAAAQVTVANDQLAIANKEHDIAELGQAQAAATLKLLTTQFTNADLYQWMSRTLGEVYRYFLQQATATARLAQAQLAFERAEPPQLLVQNDYWQSPAELTSGRGTTDRAGLTGAERLAADVTRLDQYAFSTDRRRLNLSQTFSLAQLMPVEFLNFRSTGVLSFATPMRMFDADFPGHYLRLIRQARLSMVALVPPNRGIRATLSSNGISRVSVPQATGFTDILLRHEPATVALTSPVNANGMFDMDMQADMLLPFEGSGVDTTWRFELPQAANPFDYSSIADVLLTVEYTALSDVGYRVQVVDRLNRDRARGADCVFSLARDRPDAWYTLNNPDPTVGRSVTLNLRDIDLPPNLESVTTSAVTVRLVGAGTVPATTVTLRRGVAGGTATTADGTAGTRRGNAPAWLPLCGTSPVGDWQLSFGPDADALFAAGLDDILLVIGWAGQAPVWPA